MYSTCKTIDDNELGFFHCTTAQAAGHQLQNLTVQDSNSDQSILKSIFAFSPKIHVCSFAVLLALSISCTLQDMLLGKLVCSGQHPQKHLGLQHCTSSLARFHFHWWTHEAAVSKTFSSEIDLHHSKDLLGITVFGCHLRRHVGT